MLLLVSVFVCAAGAVPQPTQKPMREAPASFAWAQRRQAEDMNIRADGKRDEAIAKLRQIVGSLGEGVQRAELSFRLADLLWSKSRALHLRGMTAWDAALQRWHEAGGGGASPKRDSIEAFAESRIYRHEALALYESILARYPDYTRLDEVLYDLASTQHEAGATGAMVKTFQTLIGRYPQSDFAADAWLQLGEHFFAGNALAQAAAAYGKAAATRRPRIYAYALYKLAWCDFNLQAYRGALQKFAEVVAYAQGEKPAVPAAARESDAMGQKDRMQLLDEALSDMVRVYAHVEAIDEAGGYFTRILGPKKSYGYMVRLAQAYADAGKHALQIAVLERLNAAYPDAVEVPANQLAQIAAHLQMGASSPARELIHQLVETLGRGEWARHHGADARRVRMEIEGKLVAQVAEQQRTATLTGAAAAYALTADLCAAYLEIFPRGGQRTTLRFACADVLFALKRYEEAAEQYALVAAASVGEEVSSPTANASKVAAYKAVVAWDKVVTGADRTVGRHVVERAGAGREGLTAAVALGGPLRERGAPTELTPAEVHLVGACDRYVTLVAADDRADDDAAMKVTFKAARVYYLHNEFAQANARFSRLIERWAESPLARVAVRAILQALAAQRDWVQLTARARAFRQQPALMADAGLAEFVSSKLVHASFNAIHDVYEPKGSAKEIAAKYAALAEEFPQCDVAAVALYNAVLKYEAANMLPQAMKQANIVLSTYGPTIGGHPTEAARRGHGDDLPSAAFIWEKVLFLQASYYVRIALFADAAALYERFARQVPKAPRRADALFNAGELREAMGDSDAAIANFRAYLRDFPQNEDAAEISWRVGLLLEKKGSHQAAAAHFAVWSPVYGGKQPARGLCAAYKAARARRALGRNVQGDGQRIIDGYRNVAEGSRDGCAHEAAAWASFQAIDADFAAYLDISLSGSEQTVARNIVRKLEAADDLQRRYIAVLQLGQGEFGIASLQRIGVVYQHLAEALFNSPCPRRLDEAQCGIYRDMLRQKALPLDEKAHEALAAAQRKGFELGLYDDWLLRTQEALRRDAPGGLVAPAFALLNEDLDDAIPKLVEAYR